VDRAAIELSFVCNGVPVSVAASADRLLIDVLREDLGLTGTKLGCGTGDCGACTVLLDGLAGNACLVYASECQGLTVETVEAVAASQVGRRVVAEFSARGAVQCGICTPGFVVAAVATLEDLGVNPGREAVQEALAGNLCRCTGYEPIIEATLAAASKLSGKHVERISPPASPQAI